MGNLSVYGLKGTGEYDLHSGNFFYRVGNLGVAINGWRHMDDFEREQALGTLHAADAQADLKAQVASLAGIPPMVLEPYEVHDYRDKTVYGYSPDEYQAVVSATYKAKQKEVDFQRVREISAKDIRDMSMAEYGQYRKSMGFVSDAPDRGILSAPKPRGVSLNTGSGFMAPAKELTKFERWKDAREKFINGDITDIEEVLKHVESGEDGYSKLVDMEIAEERESRVTVHKHRFDWRRWPLWRWLVAGLHWRNLGRSRDREDDIGSALRQRSRAALGGPLDYGGF